MTPSAISNMLGSKGQSVSIVGSLSVTMNPATRALSSTAYSATANAALLPLNSYKWAKNSDVVTGDESLLLAAVDSSGATIARPPLGATITLADGVTKYTLIAVDPLHPSGDELLYDCVVRGS